MAEKETKNEPKDLIEAVPEEVEKLDKAEAKEESKRPDKIQTAEEKTKLDTKRNVRKPR